MKRLRRSHRPWLDSDSGVSLVMVLVFLMFTGLVVASVMRLSHVSLNAAFEAHDQAELVRDGDGALAAAINGMRNSTFNNDVGEQCDPFTMNGPNSSQKLAVTCKAGALTGALGQVAFGSGNRPPAGLMTLGNTSETGIHETGSSGSSQLSVEGGAQSNSTITAGPGSLVVTRGQASARSACNGTITSTPAAACDTGVAVADPAVAAPGDYVQPSAGMTYQPVPPCPATEGATVEFAPGYYDDAEGLTNLMSTCTGHTFWFPPGTYYFDFHNGESPAFQGSPVWSITNSAVRVVAGTPPTSGPGKWDPDAATREVPQIPGACVSPTESADNNGVEFVFGGRSQLSITAGQMEICGQYYTDRPPIGIYGAKTGADPPETNEYGLTLTSAGPGVPACRRSFTNGTNARYQDSNPTTHTALNTNFPTACSTFTGFVPATAIPRGAVLTNATLYVRHVESVQPAANGLTAAITPTGASSPVTVQVTPFIHSGSSTYGVFTKDITSSLFSEVHRNGFAGASIRYFVQRGASNLQARLDTIQLNLNWKAPAVRAQSADITGYTGAGSYSVLPVPTVKTSATSATEVTYDPLPVGTRVTYRAYGAGETPPPGYDYNCVGTTPYPDPGRACAGVIVAGSQSALYVQGTGYAPLSAFDMSQPNVSSPVFRVGLVARKLQANMEAASGYTGPMIMIPPDTPGGEPLKVYFQEYVCPLGQEADCPEPGGAWQLAPPWVLSGSASAKFVDASGQPVTGSRAVEVLTWDLGLDLPH